ncbi:hypothetical protein AAKU55_004750 [Oxalobacteraceae bacterium GrIS 1.11]
MKNILTAFLLCLLPYATQAGDLAKGDSTRAEIVKALHASKDYAPAEGMKFDVRRAWASKKFAYFCALLIDETGHYEMTDDQYDQEQIILVKEAGVWKPVGGMGGFATSPRKVICLPEPGFDLSDEYLKQKLKKEGVNY